MTDKTMSEESLERASVRLTSMLGLVRQVCADGRARAKALAASGYIVEPSATTAFAEAEDYLISTTPRLELALPAALLAKAFEPEAYGCLFDALHTLLTEGLEETTRAELELAQAEPTAPSVH